MSTTSAPTGAASPRPFLDSEPELTPVRPRAAPAPQDAIALAGAAIPRPRRAATAPRPSPAPARPPARKPATAARTTSTSSGEWSFLDDPKLSIDDKLLKFVTKLAKKTDDAIVKKMKEMRGETSSTTASRSSAGAASGTTASPSKRSGGIFGGLLDAVKTVATPLGLVDKVLGEAGMDALLKSVTGPVLAAGATALGMPQLAPVLLKLGPQAGEVAHGAIHALDGLVGGLVDGVAGAIAGGSGAQPAPSSAASSGSSRSSGTTSTGSATGTYDQVDMIELQRMTEKQKEMMAAISNTLRALHDMRMSAIQNIR